MMQHIVLIGFMGAGKTTIGKKLARKADREFIDTDEMIETQTGEKISDIFAVNGEAYFRKLETGVLRQLIEKQENCVIAVGGGLPMQPDNHPLLKQMGTVVYLQAETDTLVQRLKNDKSRPKLQGGNLRERIEALMNEREATYRKISNVSVVTDHRRYGEIVQEIMEKTGMAEDGAKDQATE